MKPEDLFEIYHKNYWRLQEDEFNRLNPDIYKNQKNAFIAGFETALLELVYYNEYTGKFELTSGAEKMMEKNK